MAKKMYTIKEMQEILGVSEATVFKFVRDGELRGFKVGHAWRFTDTDIDAFIELRRQKEAKKPVGV